MFFYSTNKQSPVVNFKTATLNGQAPDKGLYFPEKIHIHSTEWIKNISHASNEAIAYTAIKPYVGDTIPNGILQAIVAETISFPIPLVEINSQISSLELFHGPTLAFNVVVVCFLSRCLGYFAKNITKKIMVLVATSGDTGGAVANGFYNVPGIDVVILYPSGKVSTVQEKQLTTIGKNIKALEVKGSFDDCQAMVKDIFSRSWDFPGLFLTSANSINVARWLPQQFYYFFACKQWKKEYGIPVIAVPSGNFGNICAGLVAKVSGLPVKHFIAACNANNTVPEFFKTGNINPKSTIATISNAMDVSNPSNFVRILELFQHQIPELKKSISAYSISDSETKETIISTYKKYKYLLDPHGAVGFFAMEKYLQQNPQEKGFIVETAHPVKFYDVVESLINEPVPVPNNIQSIRSLKKQSTVIENNVEELTAILKKLH